MADTPTPRSYQQILGDSIDVLLSKAGLKGIKVGGPIAEILETQATSAMRTSQDIFQALASRDVDNADGEALARAGRDEGLSQRPATFGSTKVTIGDSTFTKVATRVYQGKPAPVAGSTTIFVSDASLMPATGSIYIGRGTSNVEGPIVYTSRVQDVSGAFWTITLTTNTSKFHNVSETVILAQGGNRVVSIGVVVGTLPGITGAPIKFQTTNKVTVSDGENSLDGVRVVCLTPGISGNAPKGAIQTFDSVPFVGATVTNSVAVFNARPAESKEEFRERIKAVRRSKTKGTNLAILTSVFRANAQDEDATVTSSSLVSQGNVNTLYIDDGSGYEPKSAGVAIESLVDNAAGGEQDFQILGGVPLAKAFSKAGVSAPYSLTAGSVLAVRIGGIVSTVSFLASNFLDITNASAFEVVAAINSNASSLFAARTTDSGRSFIVFSKSDFGEDLQVTAPSTGTDANISFAFPKVRFDTLRLYKNDQILYKDGLEAAIETTAQSAWDTTNLVDGGTGINLSVTVDGTASVVYNFVDADFVNAKTGFTKISASNSLAAWVAVINAKISGVTAIALSNTLRIKSNLGAATRASLTINLNSSSLGFVSMFSTTSATGRDNDYLLNRNTGETHLTKALQTGDRLSAGTVFTRAYIESTDFSSATVGTAGANLWWVADGAGQVIGTGITNGLVLTVSVLGVIVTLTAPSGTPFSNVKTGDWMILWDAAFSPTLTGVWRVSSATATTVAFEVGTTLPGAGALPAISTLGLVVVRTPATIQKLNIPAGVVSPASISTTVAAQMAGVTASTVRTTRVRVTTDTFGSEGDIALVASDTEGAKLPFTIQTVLNEPSHLGSAESGNTDHGTPNFAFEGITAVGVGNVTTDDTIIVPGQGIVWKNPVSTDGKKVATNFGAQTVATAVTGSLVSYQKAPNKPAVGDRLFGCSLFALGPEDVLNVVLDQDAVSKSFSATLAYKVAPTNAAIGYYGATLTVAQGDGSGASLTSAFPATFDFSDFVLHTQARAVTNPPADADATVNAVLWRFKRFGPDGKKARISFTNPTTPSQDFAVSTSEGDLLDIFVKLPSAAARAPVLGQRYAVQSSVYGAPNLRKIVYFAGVRATCTTDATGHGTATITTGVGQPNPYITSHGYVAGDVAYLSGGTVFPAGFVTVSATGLTATVFQFDYQVGGLAPISAAGELVNVIASTGVVPTTPLNWAGVVVGDIVTVGVNTLLDLSTQGTFRVSDFDSGNGLWMMVHAAAGTALNFGYKQIVSSANFQVYPLDITKTVTTGVTNLATLVNALLGNLWVTGAIAAYKKSGVPVVGSPVTISTFDAYLEDQTKPQFGFTFSGGNFYIPSSSYNGTNYVITINGTAAPASLWSSDEDWTNERAFLVPVTTPALVRYLNLTTITGLPSNSEVKAAASLGKLQFASLLPGSAGGVKVTGGVANSVLASIFDAALPTTTGSLTKIKASDAVGLFGGQWVAVQGIGKVPKRLDWTTATNITITAPVPPSTFSTVAVSVAGTVAKYAGAMTATLANLPWQIEKHGRFAAYVFAGVGAPTDFSAVKEGDWVQVASAASGSQVNKGTFRVVRISFAATKYAFWVENVNMVEESIASVDSVTFWTADSILPGDTFSVNTAALGAANQNNWVVQALGVATLGVVSSFTVQGTMTALVATALGNDVRNVQGLPQNPSRLIKRIAWVAPNTLNSTYMTVAFDTQGAIGDISAAAGTFISPLDKLAFSSDLALGLDAYQNNTGLIAECQKILYGNLSDKDTYPGVIAKGANINISGPFVRRFQLSLSIRVRQGTQKDVIERVQSAVAQVVNSAGVGQSVSFSDIISAAKKVRGVSAVTILSPTFGPGNDLISVQSFEKPMILNLNTDVLVSLSA